ncbi:hypothetical protein ACSNOI_29870 [Actinomadura kijaniata]|uniref:hypothetical protein n=1 Tax=Actinomadura kijaniata TaxID=46161 RepID=UPI003F1C0C26
MIPAGRTPITAEQAAELHGMSLKAARASGLFDEPDFPPPLTRGLRKRLFDLDQVRAHARGEPVPAIARISNHQLDLLERDEAAELWKVSRGAWDKYMKQGYTPPPDEQIGGNDLWFRQTLTDFERPGQAAGAGRPRGARDSVPRTYRTKDQRLALVTQVIADAGPDATTTQLVQEIEQRAQVTTASAYRMLAEARKQASAQHDA